jgi:hypothetical protein
MNKLISIIFGSSILIWIISCSIWSIFGKPIFYIGTAITILGLFLTIYLLKTGIPKWLTSFGFFVSLNCLLDEILFTPWEFNITEYIVASIALVYYYLKYKNK